MSRYECSVFVALGGATGVQFGAESREEIISKSLEYVTLFFANEPSRQCIHVEAYVPCSHCEGRGFTYSKARKRVLFRKELPCKRCNLGNAHTVLDVFVHRDRVDPSNTITVHL